MASSKFELSSHAATVIAERKIEVVWVERVLASPERIEAGRSDPALTSALGRIAEHGNRVLRVVYNANVEPLRIVTVYFDRSQKDKP